AVAQHERDVPGLHARRTLRAYDCSGHEHCALGDELLCSPRHGGAHHCGGSARPCIAAQTRAGVQGMSMWSTPCDSCRASITALTIAGGEPTVGDSPTPLAPIGWCGDGVTVSPSSQAGTSSAVGIR